MTKEKVLKVTQEIKATEQYKAFELGMKRLQSALNDDVLSDVIETKVILDKAKEELNKVVKSTYFDSIFADSKSESEIVLKAIELGSFSLYGYSEKKDKSVVISEKMYIISLEDLEEAYPKALLSNGQVLNWFESLNHAVFSLVAKKMEITEFPKEYKPSQVSKAAKLLSLPKFDSNNDGVKALQKVVDAVVFVAVEGKPELNSFKAISKDLQALTLNYSKWSRNGILEVKLPNLPEFKEMLMRVLHRIVTNGSYSVK